MARLFCRFYYALLASIALYKKSTPCHTPQSIKRHLRSWLCNARAARTFHEVVLKDIEWLLEHCEHVPMHSLEQQLKNIYQSGRFLCLSIGVSPLQDNNGTRLINI